MNVQWTGIALVGLAYLLGGIPFGYVIVRLRKGTDVRRVGSGNIGATNVLRAAGRASGLLTLALDVAKGYLAVLAAGLMINQDRKWMALAALAAVVGHIFPVYLRFKGGKGVATALGVFLGLSVLPVLGAMLIFGLVVALWRFVSLGSILGTAVFPFLYFLLDYRHNPSNWVLLSALLCSSLIIVKHRDNIKRLVEGKENKFTGLRK